MLRKWVQNEALWQRYNLSPICSRRLLINRTARGKNYQKMVLEFEIRKSKNEEF